MKNLLLIFISFIGLSLLTTGCLANMSKLSWGVMSEAPEAVMLTVAPDEAVAVCGDTQEVSSHIEKAIKMWAKIIDRDQRIRVVGCNESARVKISANQANTGSAAAYIYPTTGEISYSDGRFPVLLHEVGHAWGLCDQYPGANNCDDSISMHGNANINQNSVMGASYAMEPQADDIEGIKYIAAMDSIPTNASWKNVSNVSSGSDNNNSTTSAETKTAAQADISGNLTVTKFGVTYRFSFVPTNSSFTPASKLRICLLYKDTCLNSPNTIWHSGMIDLTQSGSSFEGRSLSKDVFRARINFPATIYLLNLDSAGKLVQYASFYVAADGVTASSTDTATTATTTNSSDDSSSSSSGAASLPTRSFAHYKS